MFERPSGAAPFRERRALEHHRPRIGARHPQVRCIGTGIDPRALAQRPAESRRGIGLPILHLDDPILDIELESPDEPQTQFAEREPMTHRQRSCADKAFPAGAQRQTFDRPTHRIGPIEDPDSLLMLRCRFEDVAQGRDERINSTAQILQIDEDHVEGIHHRIRRLAHVSIKAEDRDAMHRIDEVRRLDHVVLLIAAQTMLRTEGSADLHVAACSQRIQRVRQVFRDGSGMREQCHAPAREWRAQSRFGDKSIDAKLHGCTAGENSCAKQSA